MQRIAREYDDVERVVVVPERLRRESVIKGIRCGGIIDAVELDESRLLIYLIFVGRALRYFDDGIKFFGRIIAERYVVPEIHMSRL